MVSVFFYGSYINAGVLESGIHLDDCEVATLAGYELIIAPRANLRPAAEHIAWGILTRVSHGDLERLYRDHAHRVLGQVYQPFPVIAQLRHGHIRPALCYISLDMRPGPVDPDYVARIATPAAQLGFPKSYVDRIWAFAT